MTVFKKLIVPLLVLVLLFSLTFPVQAAENTDQLVRKLINYFHYYQGEAQLDYQLLLEEIRQQDPALAATWENILQFWTGMYDDMAFPTGVLPDGLPQDDSLCIVVMGYYLKSDGTMRDELYERLRVALESAEKYPNSYIMCTGGGTAANDNDITEASQMAKWLRKKGIDKSRIIVEDNAKSTIQNATYGCKLLYTHYPQIKNLAVVTSDYHIYRSCFYVHTQSALYAYEEGIEPMKVVANASCRVNPNAEKDVDRQVEGIGMLTGLDVVDMSKPKLTRLTEIKIAGATEYALHGQPNLTVTAVYSSGHTRDVTAQATLAGYDFSRSGFQTVTASYTEGSTQVSAEFDIYVVPPETVPIEAAETEPDLPTVPSVAVIPEPELSLTMPVCLAAVCIVLLLFLLYLKARRAKKRRRRPKPVIKLD
jgi:hypothetical protein